MTRNSRRSSPAYSPRVHEHFEAGGSGTLRRVRGTLLCLVSAAALRNLFLSDLMAVDRAAALVANVVTLGIVLLVFRALDPTGWRFIVDASGCWRCVAPGSRCTLRGALRTHGGLASLVWLELSPPGSAGSRVLRGGRHYRWLLFADALPDDDWRRLRRRLRLLAYAGESGSRG